jgi:hypothetical protein
MGTIQIKSVQGHPHIVSRLDYQESVVRLPADEKLILSKTSRPVLRPTQLVPSTRPPGIKRLGGEGGHSHPSNAEVKKLWSYNFTPSYIFMVSIGKK